MTAACDRAESRDSTDNTEPTEKADRKDPTEQIDNAEPTDPIDRTEPLEAIERTEPSDHKDKMDPRRSFIRPLYVQLGATSYCNGVHTEPRCPGTGGWVVNPWCQFAAGTLTTSHNFDALTTENGG